MAIFFHDSSEAKMEAKGAFQFVVPIGVVSLSGEFYPYFYTMHVVNIQAVPFAYFISCGILELVFCKYTKTY